MDVNVARQLIAEGNKVLLSFIWWTLIYSKRELFELYLKEGIIHINDKDTAGHYALTVTRLVHIADMLIDKGARLIKFKWDQLIRMNPLLDLLLERGIVNINDKDTYNNYALERAVDTFSAKTISMILDKGARPIGLVLYTLMSNKRKDLIELMLNYRVLFEQNDLYRTYYFSSIKWLKYFNSIMDQPFDMRTIIMCTMDTYNFKSLYLEEVERFKYILQHCQGGLAIPNNHTSLIRNSDISNFYKNYQIFVILHRWGFDSTVLIPGDVERSRTHRTLPFTLLRELYRMLEHKKW